MKPLDKALLTQELSELIQSLKNGNLSYFDHARSKQRISQIQQICNSILNNQTFKKKNIQLEPLLYAQDFVYQSRYREFCCGVFSQDQALEDVLYQQPTSSWALLHEGHTKWQIWLLQMPNQTLLISDSGDLDHVYAWLITQHIKYQCFTPNKTTDVMSENLSDIQIETKPTDPLPAPMRQLDSPQHTDISMIDTVYQAQMDKINQALDIPVSHLPDVLAEKTIQQIQKRVLQQSSFESAQPPSPKVSRLIRKQETDISEGLSFDLGLEPLDFSPEKPIYVAPIFSTAEPNLTAVATEPSFEILDFKKPQTQFEAELQQDIQQFSQPTTATPPPSPVVIEPQIQPAKKIIPIISHTKKPKNLPDLVLNGYSCQVSALLFEAAQEKQLYRLNPEQLNCEHVDLLLHYHEIDHVFQRPIYLAEQVDQQGRFIKYLALLGAQGELQAIRLAHIFSHAQGHRLVAVSSIDWPNLEHNLFDLDALFNTYHALANLIWNNNHYYPFIPVHLIQTQKFIQFNEPPAHTDTPLLLLKERQKIRVIHGDHRLNLGLNEIAYPYLLLDRQQGISWQLIQEVIQTLPQPIDPVTLYQAICMQAS